VESIVFGGSCMSRHRLLVVLPVALGLVVTGSAVARILPGVSVRDSVYQTCAHNGVHFNKQGHANCGLHKGWSNGGEPGSTGGDPGTTGGEPTGDAGPAHGHGGKGHGAHGTGKAKHAGAVHGHGTGGAKGHSGTSHGHSGGAHGHSGHSSHAHHGKG